MEKKETKKTENDDIFENYSSLAFIVIIFCFGIPIWWKTTEIYRETLPNAEIMKLTNDPLQISTNIFIYTTNTKHSWDIAEELAELFKYNTLFLVNIKPLPININYNAHTPAILEKLIQKDHEVKTGDFLLIEWEKLEDRILLTTERTAFINNQTEAKEIYDLLLAGPFKTFPTNEISITKKQDINFLLKSRPLEDQHDVLISIINPKPEKINIKWNARKTFQLYLEPFLEHINLLSNFSVSTQWKYHVPFEFPLNQIPDDSQFGRHYKLSENQLPHIITSIEKYLGFGSPQKFQTHLVIYILPCDISPLYIYDQNNVKVNQNNLNSFASLQWGGIIIYNPPIDVCLKANQNYEEKMNFSIKSSEIVKTLLYHLEKIFEIHIDISLDGVKLEEKQSLYPRKWEYDAALRRNIIRYITTATKTLQSLLDLLENISYIVINQNVANSINSSYDNIQLARKCLQNGELIAASIYAKKAYKQSEEVFFEASLLAQLYFPDEQKYAIYIPLFLPIMVPVLTTLPLYRKFKN